jgi:methanogenic corrinoid protein MtbC1
VRERAMEGCSWTDTQMFAPHASPTHASAHRDGRSPGAHRDQPPARLSRTVESEIIPRLMLALGRSAEPACAALLIEPLTGPGEVAAFATVLLEQDIDRVLRHVEDLRARGMALEDVYLRLLAPTARHLGEMWVADTLDFTMVTIALGRLQQVVREVSSTSRNETDPRDQLLRALLVPAAGEQHTFGLVMVAEFFLRAGWDVWGGPLSTTEEVVALVSGEWFDMVGVSLSRESLLANVAIEIREIRRASRNQAIAVMVGGPVFTAHPQLALEVGADATAPDGKAAPIAAERLVDRLQVRG